MDYGNLLKRAWDMIWDNKWLILLGIIVALGSGGTGSGGSGSSYNFGEEDFNTDGEFQFNPEDFGGGNLTPEQQAEMEQAFRAAVPMIATFGGLAIVVIIAIALVFWAISMIAQGGLIGGVDTLERGGTSSFREAWAMGWAKGWRMLGIGLVPAIPTAAIMGASLFLGASAFMLGGGLESLGSGPVIATLITVACIAGLLAFVLGILANFAYRAAMIEDRGVFEAYERGWQVLKANLGPAVLLWLIQVGIGIGIGFVLIMPAMCCIMWPVLVVVNGGIQAFFSTLWTLAWNEWSGGSRQPIGEPLV